MEGKASLVNVEIKGCKEDEYWEVISGKFFVLCYLIGFGYEQTVRVNDKDYGWHVN